MRKARAFVLAALVVGATDLARAQESAGTPLINRIRYATLAAPDVDAAAAWYTRFLGYRIIDVGKVDTDLAASWGAPKTAGRTYTVMVSPANRDVGVRVVAADPVPGADADTTFGWGGLEIIVQDTYKVHEAMKAGGVEIVRAPASLGAPFASIHAMQVKGPIGEIIALTTETGDPATSNLPVPQAPIDRIFLVGVSGPRIDALRDFYLTTFKMRPGPVFDGPSPRRAKALGLPATEVFPMTLVRSAERGNTIELHALPAPAKARPRADGQLPPGVAIVSFGVASLDIAGVAYLTPPASRPKAGYGGARAATFIGPAGELIEFIEERR
ncbi:MAG: VOC family protein [Rhodospirillaceae bacterium]|nr:VOC family protein [Rhodospirillaceae bacterium]